MGFVTAERDRRVLAVDAAFHEMVDGFDEVVAVELRVEAQDRASEQAVNDLLLPRANAEGLGVRPGDVPEGDDGRLRQLFADQLGQQARNDSPGRGRSDRAAWLRSTTACANFAFTLR